MKFPNFENYSVCLFYKSMGCIPVILLSSLVVVVVLARMEGSLLLFQKKYFTKGSHHLKKSILRKSFTKEGGSSRFHTSISFIVNDPKNSKKINFHKSHRGGLRFMKLFRI